MAAQNHNLGPTPEYNFQSTPLMVGGVIYTTAGTRRAVLAADAATGELLWMHRVDEGERGAAAPRRRSGRGLAYRDDGGSGQILYVTPGYTLVSLDAATGQPTPGFGDAGIVDLKQNMDQDIDLVTGEVGLHAAPLVAGDTIMVGAAHRPGSTPPSMKNVKGTSAGSMPEPAHAGGFFTPFPEPTSSATTPGSTSPGATRATLASGGR